VLGVQIILSLVKSGCGPNNTHLYLIAVVRMMKLNRLIENWM